MFTAGFYSTGAVWLRGQMTPTEVPQLLRITFYACWIVRATNDRGKEQYLLVVKSHPFCHCSLFLSTSFSFRKQTSLLQPYPLRWVSNKSFVSFRNGALIHFWGLWGKCARSYFRLHPLANYLRSEEFWFSDACCWLFLFGKRIIYIHTAIQWLLIGNHYRMEQVLMELLNCNIEPTCNEHMDNLN